MTLPRIVNPVPAEAAVRWLEGMMPTLLSSPDDGSASNRRHNVELDWDPGRTWGVFEREQWVATLATEARTLSVPDGRGGGRCITADALTAVTVSPTHRRRGLLRAMLTDSLAAAHRRGDIVSMLIAAEWPIYGRFGYSPATIASNYTLRPRRPHPLLPPPGPGLRRVTNQEVLAVVEAVFAAAAATGSGEVGRDRATWARRLALEGFEAEPPTRVWIVHEGPAGADGLLAWHRTRDFELYGPLGAIAVDELIAGTDQAYIDLWSYLCSMDVVEEITLTDRPVDERVRWRLHDGRALTQTETFDKLWVRLLDVPSALTARGYAVAERIVFEVVDEGTGGYGAGVFALDTTAPDVRCVRSAEEPELRLTQRALASIYLGGHRLSQLTLGESILERNPGALTRMDVLFAVPRAPWTSSHF